MGKELEVQWTLGVRNGKKNGSGLWREGATGPHLAEPLRRSEFILRVIGSFRKQKSLAACWWEGTTEKPPREPVTVPMHENKKGLGMGSLHRVCLPPESQSPGSIATKVRPFLWDDSSSDRGESGFDLQRSTCRSMFSNDTSPPGRHRAPTCC